MQSAKIVTFPQKEQISKHNLPAQPTPLIGREQDVASVGHLLRNSDVHLLTLTGTAGVGKTRLALQVAVDMIDDFTDGVYFVPLASLSDPNLVVPAIAQTLGLGETANLPLLDLLNAYLQHKHLLLLLDNFEQILPAAAGLADLLATCPHLKLLVTSREVLHLRAEHQYPVPPLALPNLKRISDIESLAQYAAVELFIERTQAVKQNFALTKDNAPAVAQICSRLDGLPLAIELAAARVKLLSPQALLARLEHRLEVLTGGAQDLPERQQTLRNTIEWSYDLLSAEEQRLFRRLSVFAGGCILEAVVAICTALGDGDGSVLNNVASLIDKSLLQHRDQAQGELRLEMLETIREYGLETLAATGEMEVTQRVHAQYYLRLAEEAEPELTSREQGKWFRRLERDYANLRAVWCWLMEQEAWELALRLGGALWPWWMRDHLSEGRNFLERVLSRSQGVMIAARAKALNAAGMLAGVQGDFDQMEARCTESLELSRKQEDIQGMAFALWLLAAVAMERGDYVGTHKLGEEALERFREVNHAWGTVCVLDILASAAADQGEFVRARVLVEEMMELSRKAGDPWNSARSHYLLAYVNFFQGEFVLANSLCEQSLIFYKEVDDTRGMAYSLLVSGSAIFCLGNQTKARSLLEESLMLFKEVRDRRGIAWGLYTLGVAALIQGNYTTARAFYEQTLTLLMEVGHQMLIALCLDGLAGAASLQGHVAWAARLWGAAEARSQTIGISLPHIIRMLHEQLVAAARDQLGESAFTIAWAEGRTMTPEQVLSAKGPVRESVPIQTDSLLAPPPKRAAVKKTFGGLTEREREVAALIAQGKANREIAEVLVVNYRTVEKHIENILSKLGFASRVQIAVWATEKGLGKKEQS